MSRRRLHLPEAWADPSATQCPLEGPPLHYLARVLRLGVGDEVWLFDGEGRERPAQLVSLAPGAGLLELGASQVAAVAPSACPVMLLAGLTRGGSLDRVLREATELGVSELWPVICERSVAVPPPERRGERQRRWQRIVEEAARQCGRAELPLLRPLVELPAALAVLQAEAERWPLVLVGDPLTQLRLGDAFAAPVAGVALVVGPEGGLSPAELAAARAAGCLGFGLGARVLRAETAGTVCVALALHRVGELG